MKLSHFLILLSLCCLMAPSAQAKTNSTHIQDKEFGFLDFEIVSHEPGIQCVSNLNSKVPTVSGSINSFDVISLFDLKGSNGKLYKSLSKTIACNPGKILVLQLKRGDRLEKVELQIHSSASLGVTSPEKKITARHFLEEERRFRPIPRNAFKNFGSVPDFVELFSEKLGPSPILLRPRLLGLRALSLPYKSSEAQAILRALAQPAAPTLIYIEKDGRGDTITEEPEIIEKRLQIEAFAERIKPQLLKLKTLKDACKINYPQDNYSKHLVLWGEPIEPHECEASEISQHCDHAAPPSVKDTWPDNLNIFANSGVPSLEERTKLDKVCHSLIEAINSSRLDTPTARQMLQGEASLEGNSLLAGNQNLASFYPIKKLAPSPEETIFPSNNTAVVKIRQGTSSLYSYMFFQKAQSWKLTAIRTPCLNRTTANLGLKPDKYLLAWFKSNREGLHELVPLLQAATGISREPVFKEQIISLKLIFLRVWSVAYHNPSFLPELLSSFFAERKNDTLRAKLHELGFICASQSPNDFNGYYLRETKTSDGNFYLALPSPNCSTTYIIFSPQDQPPGISPNGLIWVKKLDSHWYLARSAGSNISLQISRSTF